MTGKTYPITVHLTDEQMGQQCNAWPPCRALAAAIEAQRPRPIAVGDQVTWGSGVDVYKVKTIEEGWAWLWWPDGGPYGSRRPADLTRVDDETQP